MNDESYREIAQDLEIADLPAEHQKILIEKFAESLIGRLMVEVGGNMSPEQRAKVEQATTPDEQVAAIEEAFGQSFEEINEAVYTNLVQEFKDLTK